jgi:hypothetical protein
MSLVLDNVSNRFIAFSVNKSNRCGVSVSYAKCDDFDFENVFAEWNDFCDTFENGFIERNNVWNSFENRFDKFVSDDKYFDEFFEKFIDKLDS